MIFKYYKASVALVSLLLISAITLLLALGMSEVNISKSYQYQNNEANKMNLYLAESCLEDALLRLKSDPEFNSGSINFDANSSCSVSISGSETLYILITANFYDFSETYQAEVTHSQDGEVYNLSLDNWEET